jgi:hypothetical protein
MTENQLISFPSPRVAIPWLLISGAAGGVVSFLAFPASSLVGSGHLVGIVSTGFVMGMLIGAMVLMK